MKKMIPAANPDAYVETLGGWRRSVVENLRSTVRAAPALEEVVKWGRDEIGSHSTHDVLQNGGRKSDFAVKRWSVTINRDMNPDETRPSSHFMVTAPVAGKCYGR